MNIFELLNKLEENEIFYKLSRIREDSVLVEAVIPGQRWEIELFEDGHLEIEKFISDGEFYDESELKNLFLKDSN